MRTTRPKSHRRDTSEPSRPPLASQSSPRDQGWHSWAEGRFIPVLAGVSRAGTAGDGARTPKCTDWAKQLEVSSTGYMLRAARSPVPLVLAGEPGFLPGYQVLSTTRTNTPETPGIHVAKALRADPAQPPGHRGGRGRAGRHPGGPMPFPHTFPSAASWQVSKKSAPRFHFTDEETVFARRRSSPEVPRRVLAI